MGDFFSNPSWPQDVLSMLLIDLYLLIGTIAYISLCARALPYREAAIIVTVALILVYGRKLIFVVYRDLAPLTTSLPFIALIGGIMLIGMAIAPTIIDEKSDCRVSMTKCIAVVSLVLIADLVMDIPALQRYSFVTPGETKDVVVGIGISIIPLILFTLGTVKVVQHWTVVVPLAQTILGWTAGKVISADTSLRATLIAMFPIPEPDLFRALEITCIVLSIVIVLAGRKLMRLKYVST